MNTIPSSKMNSTTNTVSTSVPVTTTPNNPSSGRSSSIEQTPHSSIHSLGAITTTNVVFPMSETAKTPSATLLQNWNLLPPHVH